MLCFVLLMTGVALFVITYQNDVLEGTIFGEQIVGLPMDISFVATTGNTQRVDKSVIGYAVSITKCQPDDNRLDQAAVLLYSIHRNSRHNPESGSKYGYKAYAFLHPDASNCTEIVERIGYEVHIRESPVLKENIKGALKEFVSEASCCQEKEFLKLYSYTLVDHAAVVHLDLDCLVLQPLDDLFDSIIEGPNSLARQRLPLQWKSNNSNLPDDIEAFFTRDYNMVDPGVRLPHQIGVQGGFIVVKPNLDIFSKYQEIIMEGNYSIDGWGGALRYGGYYGAAQFQGLCAYFFGAIRPGKALELNRCYYNFMGDAPRESVEPMRCRTLEEECQDCRQVPFNEIKTIHFTVCGKPWWCHAHENNKNREMYLGGNAEAYELCLHAQNEWFRTRALLEKVWSDRDAHYNMTWGIDAEAATFGFCTQPSSEHYKKMKMPEARIVL